jgi:hypothetical protein
MVGGAFAAAISASTAAINVKLFIFDLAQTTRRTNKMVSAANVPAIGRIASIWSSLTKGFIERIDNSSSGRNSPAPYRPPIQLQIFPDAIIHRRRRILL